MLWAAASFALGVLWARFATDPSRWTPPNWPIFAAILLLIFAGIALKRRPLAACGIALLAIAMLGRAQFGLERRGETAPLPQELDNQNVEITGFVTRAALPVLESNASDPDSEQGAQETYQQVDLQTEAIRILDQDGTRLVSPPGMGAGIGVRIGAYGPAGSTSEHDSVQYSRGSAALEFHYGQRLQVRGRIHALQTYGDHGVFDRRGYLLDNRIAATVSAKSTEIEALPGHGGSRWGTLRAQARRSLLRHVLALQTPEESMWRIFSISSKDAALLAAMILGERSLLDQKVKLDFQRTGAYHLLIVSGMAVTILAFSVFWLARLLRLPDSAATILSVLFVGLYVSVTDLGAPVQRAALMCVVYMLARLLYRERNPLKALGVAAIVALLIDPHALFDAGFQMTFLAVLTIAGIAVPVIERTTAP